MASRAYVTKGYSTYTNIPTGGDYDHRPKNSEYAVQTNTNTSERVRAPGAWSNDLVGSPSKIELLNEYVYSPTMSSSPKTPNAGFGVNNALSYENSSPPKFHYEGSWPMKTRDYHSSSPIHGYQSEEAHLVQPSHGFAETHTRTGNISGTNRSWQSAGPPLTHHPLTTSTDNINEALGFLESVNHSPRSDPRQRGVLDELSTRAQPTEPQQRYARPAFVAKPNDIYRKRY
ncbi:hypothetical protein LXL04_021044 [Taraxacum kok-saghyz]